MAELRTLKDISIVEFTVDGQKARVTDPPNLIDKEILKYEAIKWYWGLPSHLEDGRPNPTLDFIKIFFNLTGEDLK